MFPHLATVHSISIWSRVEMGSWGEDPAADTGLLTRSTIAKSLGSKTNPGMLGVHADSPSYSGVKAGRLREPRRSRLFWAI